MNTTQSSDVSAPTRGFRSKRFRGTTNWPTDRRPRAISRRTMKPYSSRRTIDMCRSIYVFFTDSCTSMPAQGVLDGCTERQTTRPLKGCRTFFLKIQFFWVSPQPFLLAGNEHTGHLVFSTEFHKHFSPFQNTCV